MVEDGVKSVGDSGKSRHGGVKRQMGMNCQMGLVMARNRKLTAIAQC